MKRRSTMLALVEEYLVYRRSMGFELRIDEGQLRSFARHADGIDHQGPLTVDLVVRWAALPSLRPRQFPARRVDVIRPFARYRAAIDPANAVPPSGILGPARYRSPRHIYTDEQIASLVEAARKLSFRTGLRPHTYVALFGLLAACALRISEALRLERHDVDLDGRVLTIRMTKFRKSRFVPLHPTTATALFAYARRRNRMVRRGSSDTFFVTEGGTPLPYSTVCGVFSRLRVHLGWARWDSRPRIHDLRHSWACRRLQRWYEDGVDVAARLPAMATYLGHAHVTDMYWYLTGSPDLLSAAASRFEQFASVAHEWSRQ